MAYAAVILAAGQASRFRAAGGSEPTKLVALWEGQPLVRHVALAALASAAHPIVLVSGHAHDAVQAAVSGLPLRTIHNPDFAGGIATSLTLGLAALSSDVAGAVILLGDMPGVSAAIIDRLIMEAERHGEADAVLPVHSGERGNPVILSARMFDRVTALRGDAGARSLLRDPACRVLEVPVDGDAVMRDIDEPGDLTALLGEGRKAATSG